MDMKKRAIEKIAARIYDSSLCSVIERGNLFCGLREALDYTIHYHHSYPEILRMGAQLLIASEFVQQRNWWIIERYHLPEFVRCAQLDLTDQLTLRVAHNLILGHAPWHKKFENKFGDRELAFGHPYDDEVLSSFYKDLQKILIERDPELAKHIALLRDKHQSKKDQKSNDERAKESRKKEALRKISE
jgi:hypothetical protein